MEKYTLEELRAEHEKIVSGLQYTIGERERLKLLIRLVSEYNSASDRVTPSEILKAITDTKSERFQDIFALLISNGKRNGFFVEFGACDGLVANNTFILESRFEWTGILAEPNKFWQERLVLNRRAAIDKRCVSSSTGNLLDFFQSDRPGNSSPDEAHPYLGKVTASYKVETVSLLDLLIFHKAPTFIDFLTIDTEGHEREVLKNFDFRAYRFGFVCVEEHEGVAFEDSVQPIFEKAGYCEIFARDRMRPSAMQITGVDRFFVPNDSWAAVWHLA